MTCPFSFLEYSKILLAYKKCWKDFGQPLSENFALLRHDVEFSTKRALDLARIEAENGICSTYNFQVCTHAYNITSIVNRKRISEIREMGHKIGLHFYFSHITDGDWDRLIKEFSMQMSILNSALGIDCDRFSYHRPKAWVLADREDTFHGVINEYGQTFFEFSPSPELIKYTADSRHQWDYGHPLECTGWKRIQILIHPDEWSLNGYGEEDNFRSLKEEHGQELTTTFLDETPKNYKKYEGKI